MTDAEKLVFDTTLMAVDKILADRAAARLKRLQTKRASAAAAKAAKA